MQKLLLQAFRAFYSRLPADAIFACNDTSTPAIIKQAKHSGISLPGEPEVNAYSNDPFSEVFHPSITGIEQQ